MKNYSIWKTTILSNMGLHVLFYLCETIIIFCLDRYFILSMWKKLLYFVKRDSLFYLCEKIIIFCYEKEILLKKREMIYFNHVKKLLYLRKYNRPLHAFVQWNITATVWWRCNNQPNTIHLARWADTLPINRILAKREITVTASWNGFFEMTD